MMRKGRMRATVYALCLALLAAQGAQLTGGPTVAALENGGPTAVEGRGWLTFSICVGCVISGISLTVTGGIVAAASVPGSTMALAGCIAACHDAIFD